MMVHQLVSGPSHSHEASRHALNLIQRPNKRISSTKLRLGHASVFPSLLARFVLRSIGVLRVKPRRLLGDEIYSPIIFTNTRFFRRPSNSP